MSMIEFYDGNSGELTKTVPSDQVPPANREVYYRDGRQVASFQEGDTIVAVARVVKTSYLDNGEKAPQEDAAYIVIEEFDSDGRSLRHTRLVPKSSRH